MLEAVVVAVIAAQHYDLKRGKKCVKFIFRRFKLFFEQFFFLQKRTFFRNLTHCVAVEQHCGECCNFHPLDLEKEENKSIKLKSAGKLLKCYVKSSIITQMK